MFDVAGTRYDAIEKYRKNSDTHGQSDCHYSRLVS